MPPGPVERGRRRRSDDTQTGGTVGGSAAGALLALQEQAGAARRTGTEAMLAENHTHSVPRADDDWRSFLIGNARSFRQALLAYRDGARIHAGTRPGAPQMETADAQLRFLCEAGFSAGDAVNALMTISYFTVGAVLEEQAGDSDAGERGGTVEQAPLSPLLRAAIDAFDEADPDAAFEQGLAVIVDGLAKRRLVVRNVEGPRKGDD